MKDYRFVLDPVFISYKIEAMELFKDYPKESKSYHVIEEILNEHSDYLKPKAILKWCKVRCDANNSVWIGDTMFKSKLLYEKLKNHAHVFINIVTAGQNLEHLRQQYDMMDVNLAAYGVLTEARQAVRRYLEREFNMKAIGELMPGSLPDWPVANNHQLFEIAGGAEEIGLALDEAGFMYQINSIAGILYPEDDHFVSCRLCKRKDCVGRKEDFSEKAYQQIFGV